MEVDWDGLEFIDGVARQLMPNKTLPLTGAAIAVSQDSKSLETAPAAELSLCDESCDA